MTNALQVTRIKSESSNDKEVIKFFDGRQKVGQVDVTGKYDENTLLELVDKLTAKVEEGPITITGKLEKFCDKVAGQKPAKVEKPKKGKVKQADEAEEGEEEGEEEDKPESKIFGAKYRIKYGRPQHCGDDIAEAMNDVTCDEIKGRRVLLMDELEKVCEANDLDFKAMCESNKGGRLPNNGLIATRVRNILRNRVEMGEYVIIGKEEFNKEEKKKK